MLHQIWLIFWQIAAWKWMHWNNSDSVPWLEDWINGHKEQKQHSGVQFDLNILFRNLHVGKFARSSERATMTTLAVITCLICLVCKIISLIHYGKGPINVGPVMSDCVLCAFTDIINAKEHFVGELVAWRETKQVRPSKTAGCPCALSGFKCSSAGPGGSWQDSIHTFFIEISQSKSHLCFRTKGESEVVSQCWELVTFHVVDF